MPTACAKVEKQNSLESSEPYKQVQVLVEKKIRNLEKRKSKLEQLKQDEETGKALHDDQKKAIKRFDEVIELLDFFKEFSKSIATIFTDHAKLTKKQLKKEQLERQQQDVDRFRNILLFQDLLTKLGNSKIRNDFLAGTNGALQLSEAQLSNLDELRKTIIPDVSSVIVPTPKELENGGERLSSLVDGKSRDTINGVSFKDLKDLLVKISECDYFKKDGKESDAPVPQTTEEKDESRNEISECDNVSPKNDKYQSETAQISERLTSTVTENQQLTTNVFNVIQNTRFERDQDPAVIAMAPAYPTYSCVPPSDTLTHGMNLTVATTQKVNFEDVPIPTQTFTNQNYSFQPQISQSASIAVGNIPVQALPVQNVSPHQLHATSPTQIMTEQVQPNQQPLVPQTHSMNNFTEQTPYSNYQMEGQVESNMISHEGGITSFIGDEQSNFSQNQHGQYQRREGGYRGRGGMRGNSRGSMNGFSRGVGGGRGGHKNYGNNNYGNTGSNGSYYNDKRPNYANRGTQQKGRGGSQPSNRGVNQSSFGYQGKPQPAQQQ